MTDRMRTTRLVPVALLLVLTTAITLSQEAVSQDDRQSGHTFTVTEQDGIRLARSSAEPKYAVELFHYDPVCELQADERPESIVGRPDVLFFDEAGRCYVIDHSRGGGAIAVFSPEGCYLHRIGGPGQEGPGEFRTPLITDIRGGMIQVWDTSQNRLTRFTTAGALHDIVTLTDEGAAFTITWANHVAADRIVTFHNHVVFREDRQWIQGRVSVVTPALDTLANVTMPELRGARLVDQRDAAGRIIRFPAGTPFTTRHIFAWSPHHGIMITTGAEPELRFHTLDGRHHLTVRIDLSPEPVTRQDRRDYEAPLRERLETSAGIQSETYRRRIDALEYPEYKSYWGSQYLSPVEFDGSGFIWIRIPAANEHGTTYEEGFTHLLLSPEGEFLGRTRRPPGFTRIQFGFVGALCEDIESGEQHLRVYRPVPVVAGLKWPGE